MNFRRNSVRIFIWVSVWQYFSMHAKHNSPLFHTLWGIFEIGKVRIRGTSNLQHFFVNGIMWITTEVGIFFIITFYFVADSVFTNNKSLRCNRRKRNLNPLSRLNIIYTQVIGSPLLLLNSQDKCVHSSPEVNTIKMAMYIFSHYDNVEITNKTCTIFIQVLPVLFLIGGSTTIIIKERRSQITKENLNFNKYTTSFFQDLPGLAVKLILPFLLSPLHPVT